jgi:hypothetical protein
MPEAALPPPSPKETSESANPPPQFIERPSAPPVNMDENPDAIAMRAALSILQMQRQQSLRDMRELDKMKAMAIKDPDGFVQHLRANQLTAAPRDGVDVDYDLDANDASEVTESAKSKFPKFPAPQNVVRTPPIEWSKYGIVGEPLDKLHEIQRQYPGWTPNASQQARKPKPHQIATPYKPLTDHLPGTKQ